MTPDLDALDALAAAATDSVHPANWPYWVEHVLERSPSRNLLAALDPATVRSLIALARLGAAWEEAEAALPEGAWLEIEGPHDAPDTGKYTVEAFEWTRVPKDSVRLSEIVLIAKVMDAPAAALTALAAALRTPEPVKP